MPMGEMRSAQSEEMPIGDMQTASGMSASGADMPAGHMRGTREHGMPSGNMLSAPGSSGAWQTDFSSTRPCGECD